MEHGGETSLFPPWAPFSPVCCMEACGTRCTFFKLPRSPRRLRQRGGLNARCHSASQNIFCDVAAFAAIPSLGPCALGTHGLAPCVRVCTGMCYPVLKRSGLSAVALAKVESTVTCQRVLPAPCVRVCTGMRCPPGLALRSFSEGGFAHGRHRVVARALAFSGTGTKWKCRNMPAGATRPLLVSSFVKPAVSTQKLCKTPRLLTPESRSYSPFFVLQPGTETKWLVRRSLGEGGKYRNMPAGAARPLIPVCFRFHCPLYRLRAMCHGISGKFLLRYT